MFYFPFPTNCMSKGKPLGICETCGSEIVESVNDGVFRGGECDYCERLRYESQPLLLAACKAALRHLTFDSPEDWEAEAVSILREAIAEAERKGAN
jgi:hypothetical protein